MFRNFWLPSDLQLTHRNDLATVARQTPLQAAKVSWQQGPSLPRCQKFRNNISTLVSHLPRSLLLSRRLPGDRATSRHTVGPSLGKQDFTSNWAHRLVSLKYYSVWQALIARIFLVDGPATAGLRPVGHHQPAHRSVQDALLRRHSRSI